MKKTVPPLPFSVTDYLLDTQHLSTAQHGAYLLLLFHQWQHGSLPSDDARLAAIARTSQSEWADTIGPVVREFFDATDAGLTQKRIQRDRKNITAMEIPDDSDRDATPQSVMDLFSPVTKSKTHSTSDSEFNIFWAKYPGKRPGKPASMKEFRLARKRATFEQIMNGLARYKPDPRFVVYPERWLKHSRWLDEDEPTKASVIIAPNAPARGAGINPDTGKQFTAAELAAFLQANG